MSAFLQDVKPLTDEELQKLGIKVNSELYYGVITIICYINCLDSLLASTYNRRSKIPGLSPSFSFKEFSRSIGKLAVVYSFPCLGEHTKSSILHLKGRTTL